MASIHITKLAAAKRQIQASIRMYFSLEDGLAVHTLASAAYSILKDIKNARGRSEAADVYLTSIFFAVRDLHRGSLPLHMTENVALMKEVLRWASLLPQITPESSLDDVRVSITPDLERQYWNDTNRAANFLKHADRDSDATLALDSVDNSLLLMKCMNAYQDVAPDDLGNEGLVFSAYVTAGNGAYEPKPGSFGNIIRSLRSVSQSRRVDICRQVLLDLAQGEGGQSTV